MTIEDIEKIYRSDFTCRKSDQKRWQRMSRDQKIQSLSSTASHGMAFLIGGAYSREKYLQDKEDIRKVAAEFVDNQAM